MERKGTKIILDTLKSEGVKTLFGYPGGCVIPLFDELLNFPELQFILVRHEQGATHAADGLARVTGKAAVVIVTSGPGATNTITGIATAAMDSVPMIVITGQVKSHLIGTDAFQETNVLGVSRPITKHNYLVNDIKNIPKIIKESFHIAETGRPGAVLIDIPVDIQNEKSVTEAPEVIELRGYESNPQLTSKDAHLIWEMISQSKKPIIYAGGGINLGDASKELAEFVNKTKIPVATTLLGQGGYPEDQSLSLGMLGMHGTYQGNMAMTKTDLAIALGTRFDDRVTGKVDKFLTQAKIIHIDIDPSEIGKIIKPDIGVVSDIKQALRVLNKISHEIDTQNWFAELEALKREAPLPTYEDVPSEDNQLRPEFILNQLSKITNGDVVIVTDVGQHQMFTCLHYAFKNTRSHLSSGGLGTMGYSLPAAMGAACYIKDRPVISISGDGGFQMNLQELATIRTYDLPVKIIIFNNNNLGMVKQWQDLFWKGRYAHTLFDQNPDFIKIAEAYSIPGFQAGKKEEVVEVIHKMLEIEGPVLVEFKIDEDAHVYPMIPAGGSLHDIIVEAKK